jgi:hypothetical protein
MLKNHTSTAYCTSCVLLITPAASCNSTLCRAQGNPEAKLVVPGAQLLVNPGFEGTTHQVSLNGGNIRGTLPINWEDNSDWGGPARPHSGKYSVLMNSLGDFGQVGQWMVLPGGTSYQLSCWLRCDAPSGLHVLQLGQEPWATSTTAEVRAGSQWALVSLPWPKSQQAPSSLAASSSMRMAQGRFGWTTPACKGQVRHAQPARHTPLHCYDVPTAVLCTCSCCRGVVHTPRAPPCCSGAERSPCLAALRIPLAPATHYVPLLSTAHTFYCAVHPGAALMCSPNLHGPCCTHCNLIHAARPCANSAVLFPDANLLQNPSFEPSNAYRVSLNGGAISGTLPASWEDNASWGGPGVKIGYSLDTARPHSGKSSVLMNVTGGFGQFWQWMTLPGGTWYQLSCWLRSDAASGLRASVTLLLGKEPWTMLKTLYVSASSLWTQVVLPFAEKPPGAQVPCGFIIRTFSKGRLWVDNASLQLTGAARSTPASSASALQPLCCPLLFCAPPVVGSAWLHPRRKPLAARSPLVKVTPCLDTPSAAA